MNDTSRPKVILDLAPLGYSQDHPTGARGIHRVTQYLFDGLIASNRYDLKFVSTSHLAGAYEMLSGRGLPPDQVLNFSPTQLQFSQWGRNAARWVHAHLNAPGLGARVARWSLARFATAACAGEANIPSKFLAGVDLYHSPLRAIPPTVQAQPSIKHFLTIHDLLPLVLPIMKGRGAELMRATLASLSSESFVFCVSENVKSDVLNLTKVDPQKIFVTPLAADRQIFFPVPDPDKKSAVRRKYGISDVPYFLTLSSFDPRKNFGQIIHSFHQLVQSGQLSDCCLVIVGSNPERNSFVREAISSHPQMQSRIIMPGFIPDHDLASIYSGALGFLFPSFGEGFGMPVLEAMQCGTPVISSNATSLPEVVGDAGILLKPDDTDAWCQAMITLFSKSEVREVLRKKGLARADLFTWEKFMAATEQGYASALEEKK